MRGSVVRFPVRVDMMGRAVIRSAGELLMHEVRACH